jgi:hypothetical protein
MMPAMNFDGIAYTSTDGAFTFDLGLIPAEMWRRVFKKQADHMFGNEAIAKASPSANKGEILDAETRAEVILKAREKLRDRLISLDWGSDEKTVKVPTGDELEDIYQSMLAIDARKAANKNPRLKATKTKDQWVAPADGGGETLVGLDLVIKSFLANKTEGEAREADLRARAQVAFDAKKRDAEIRAAAKARAAAAEPTVAESWEMSI